MGFIAELRRRNVFKAGIAYVLVAWLIMQAGDVLGPALRLPDWSNSLLAFFLILGFPIALVCAWAFELTPDGLRPETSSTSEGGPPDRNGRRLDITVIVLLLIAAGYFFWESRISNEQAESAASGPNQAEPLVQNAQPALPAANKIAVLPFANVSADNTKEYFSDGITEEIINALVTIPGLHVPARTSVFGFKNFTGDIREIGRTLGVAYVLEGSVRSVGNDARITASLIDMESGLPVWSETYQRSIESIFAVQEEIARSIAARLELELGFTDAIPNRTTDVAAYDAYLRGRAALRRRDDDAIDLLLTATRNDPEFAPAWATLAIAYQSLPSDPPRAIDAAQRALEIDAKNIDAMTAMGSVLRQMRRWAESEAYFKRALAIDPYSAELLEDYAEFLNVVGRSQDALEVAKRGMEIDPLIVPLVAAYAEALASVGRTAEARDIVIDSLDDYGGQPGLWWVSLPLWLETDPQLTQSEPAMFKSGYDQIRSFLASPDAVDKLKSILTPGNEYAVRPSIDRRHARLLLIHLGEVDFVIAQDIDDPSFFPSPTREWLWSPIFQRYRSHARFPEFLARVGLNDYWDATTVPQACRNLHDDTLLCD